jgi:hypothetical protein
MVLRNVSRRFDSVHYGHAYIRDYNRGHELPDGFDKLAAVRGARDYFKPGFKEGADLIQDHRIVVGDHHARTFVVVSQSLLLRLNSFDGGDAQTAFPRTWSGRCESSLFQVQKKIDNAAETVVPVWPPT